ncbi:MAG: succinylglutamate desuccinylase/aspartoacylase family protein [Leptospiraceae bacterium]|nr:succinylglutamate desuccinylase/aspartoacylase family protein [Leptospiraceae bacterium]
MAFFRSFLIFCLLLGTADAIPLAPLHDPEAFSHLEFSKNLAENLSEPQRQSLIILQTKGKKIRALVPTTIKKEWDEKKIQYRSLAYPRRGVELDPTYRSRLRKGCVPAAEMLNGYKDDRLNELYLNCLQKEFPQIATRYVIGKSRLGRKIYALRIYLPEIQKQPQVNSFPPLFTEIRERVFINCAIHGNEAMAIEHCYEIIIKALTERESYPVLEKLELWIVPIVNPDGVHSFWHRSTASGRKNGFVSGRARRNLTEGVDLNRNFPFRWNTGNEKASSGVPGHGFFRGYAAASEPETKAVMNLVDKLRFSSIFSYHSYANSLLVPYTIEGLVNPQPDIPGQLAERLLLGIASEREDKPFLIKKNLYEVDGTDTDTFYNYYGSLAYLVESSHLYQDYKQVPAILQGIRPIWENLLNFYAEVPMIRLQVTDEFSNPLRASIEFDQFIFKEDEQRGTAADGTFSMFMPGIKQCTLTIRAEGFAVRQLSLTPDVYPMRTIVIMKKSGNP